MGEKGSWCLYKHTNKINCKSYIGITSQIPTRRWGSSGKNYFDQPKFRQAIEKHGWEMFTHEVLITGMTKEQAEHAERKFIELYDSISHGYNVLLFGNTMQGYQQAPEHVQKRIKNYCRKVYQISLADGSIIGSFKSLNEAARATGVSAGNISSACKQIRGYSQAGGYIWRYDGEQWVLPSELRVINEITRKQSVVQIERSTLVVIEKFNTILDASKETGIRGSLISSCCRGKQRQAGGYIWRYANEI